MEQQMEKQMDHEMETGVSGLGFRGLYVGSTENIAIILDTSHDYEIGTGTM